MKGVAIVEGDGGERRRGEVCVCGGVWGGGGGGWGPGRGVRMNGVVVVVWPSSTGELHFLWPR